MKLKLNTLSKAIRHILPITCLALIDISAAYAAQDSDNDGINDANDNCVLIANTGQWDKDKDGIGNECDDDIDGDGFSNEEEKQRGSLAWNASSIPVEGVDSDLDGVPDQIDNCTDVSNQGQWDKDNDGIGNECDDDIDGDGVLNQIELDLGTKVWDRLSFPNIDQLDDSDLDGVVDSIDNCINVSNQGQWDKDNDGIGNACDDDIDGDGFTNAEEELALTKVWDSSSFPSEDGDEDGVADSLDNCPEISNTQQLNFDQDEQGDACDLDDDNDSFDDQFELEHGTNPFDVLSFPLTVLDTDEDGIVDDEDNCIDSANIEQADFDEDGLGDVCDDDDDNDSYSDENESIAGTNPFDSDDHPGLISYGLVAKIEAENAQEYHDDIRSVDGGEAIGYFDKGTWLSYQVDFKTGANLVTINLSDGIKGGVFDIKLDSIDGPTIATIAPAVTAGWTSYEEQSFMIDFVDGIQNIYVVGLEGEGISNFDYFEFSHLPIPTLPSQLSANAGDSTISLDWLDNADNEQGYALYWSTTDVKPQKASAILPSNSQQYVIDSLSSGTDYYIWLEALGEQSVTSESVTTALTTSGEKVAMEPIVAISLNVYGHKVMPGAAGTFADKIKALDADIVGIQEGVQDWQLNGAQWPTDYSRSEALASALGSCWQQRYQIFINTCKGNQFDSHTRWDLTDGDFNKATRTGETALVQKSGVQYAFINIHWEAWNGTSRAANVNETAAEANRYLNIPTITVGDFNTACSGGEVGSFVQQTQSSMIIDAGIDCILSRGFSGEGQRFNASPSDHPGVVATLKL